MPRRPARPARRTRSKPAAKPAKPVAAKPTTADAAAAALRARFEAAQARVVAARASEAVDWDALYEAVGEILDDKLFVAGGYRTARAYLAAVLPGQDEHSVRSNARVARHFDPDEETRHGTSKLALLVDYLEAAGGAKLPPVRIAADRQQVVIPFGKAFKRVMFTRVSADDLRSAIRHARAKHAAHTDAAAARTPRLLTALRAALRGAKLGDVSVSLRAGHVALGNIPGAQLAALGRALARAKLPTD